MNTHSLHIALSLCGIVFFGQAHAGVPTKPNAPCYSQQTMRPDEYTGMETWMDKQKEHGTTDEMLMHDLGKDYFYISQEDQDYIKANGKSAFIQSKEYSGVTIYKKLQPDSILIDIKRPKTGKIGEPTVYDASASTVPSGNREFSWVAVTGGLTFDSTNSPKVTVTARNASNSGLNAYTRLKLTDVTCKISQTFQFNVNYTE